MNTFRSFNESDFPEYQSWFGDAKLNRELGPMDSDDGQEWLEAVLAESPRNHFVLIDNNQMVAVVGVTSALEHGKTTWYITDVATNPSQKRNGFGRIAVKQAVESIRSRNGDANHWIAWVAADNFVAQRFFRNLGWQQSPIIGAGKDELQAWHLDFEATT